MKKLLLVRHAKPESSGYSDIERPLSETGLKDAQLIGKFLKNNSFLPHIIISSPALRAKQTAELISQELSLSHQSLILDKLLYSIDSESILDYISNLKDDLDYVVVVGHNPTIEEALSILLHQSSVQVTPGTMALTSADASSWCDFRKNCYLEFFINPKLVKNQS